VDPAPWRGASVALTTAGADLKPAALTRPGFFLLAFGGFGKPAVVVEAGLLGGPAASGKSADKYLAAPTAVRTFFQGPRGIWLIN